MAGRNPIWRVTEERDKHGRDVLVTWEPTGDPVKLQARVIENHGVNISRFEGSEEDFVQGAWRVELSGPVAALVQWEGHEVIDVPDALWRAIWRKLGIRERFDF